MVELTLPKNSKINKNGKTWKAKEGAEKTRTFHVYRYDPSTSDNPSVDRYEVDVSNVSMVLDALIKIKNETDATLSFRRSCREGVCGSDGINLNGRNGLACMTPVSEVAKRGKLVMRLLRHEHQRLKHVGLHNRHG